MPKYTQNTQKLKTKKLIKAYAQAGFSQTRLAEKEGVSQPAIAQRLAREPIKKAFATMMNKEGMSDRYLRKKLKEGLEATKDISCLVIAKDGEGMKDANSMTKDFVKTEDYATRHKYLVTALELKGHIKHNGNGKGNSLIQVFYGYRPSASPSAVR